MEQQEVIKARFARVAKTLDERARRAVAASEALAIGWGGITVVSRATGLSRTVIQNGIKELTGTLPSAAQDVSAVRAAVGRRSLKPTRACVPIWSTSWS